MDKDYFSNGAIPTFLQSEPTFSLLPSSDYFLNTNLENSTDPELIGKLGTICSNNNNNNDSTMTSCYANTRFTHSGNRSFNCRMGQYRLYNGTGQHLGLSENLPRVSSQDGLNLPRVSGQDGLNNGKDDHLGLSVNLPRVSSRQCPGQPQMETKLDLDHNNPNSDEDCSLSTLNCSKRKANSSGKVKKIGKMEEEKSSEAEKEPVKDYIHVRARRGEATDSHSLAERVRREKISQRMKLLQDLVPGCNKVTGKALMLDEIINYVQSLQRQVEFLSMKLATVNPRPDFHIDNLLPKDICQLNGCLAQKMLPLDGFCDNLNQVPTVCEDELQSIVQMGFNHNFNHDMRLHSQTSSVSADSMSGMKIDM